MAYTTNQLIADAYYSAGVVARGFESVSGDQISDGLRWLNDCLNDSDVDQSIVPYESVYTDTFEIGVEAYQIDNLVQVDTLVFYLDSVRYAMDGAKRNEYFGASRVDNIQSLPFKWYVEKNLEGATLYVYFKPDREYPFEIHGVFKLANVALGQDLSETIAQFYRTYLRYKLADRICSENNYLVPDGVAKTLKYYEDAIRKKSRVIDLTMQKVSTLQQGASINWAFVNIGKGYTTVN